MNCMQDEMRNTTLALAGVSAAPASFPPYRAGLSADLPVHGGSRTVGRVGIIGANPMSLGIVVGLLDADVPVTLFDPGRESLGKVIELVRSGYRTAVTKGELGPDQGDRRMALLAGTVNFHHLKDCDLIVDAELSDRAGKEKLFRRLDQVAKFGAVLTTRAANAGVDHIAGCTRRRGDVLGLHVSASSDTEEMWTIVPGTGTSGDALGTVIALARKLRKVAVVRGIFPGIVSDAKSVAVDAGCFASSKTDQVLE